jgi:hypothetical protein
MKNHPWKNILKYDPIPALMACDNLALKYFVQRDLLDYNPGPVDQLWDLPEVGRIL